MRFRHVLLFSVAAAIVANLASYVAWEAADGAEDVMYFLLRIGAGAAVLAGAIIAWRTRGAWDKAVGAGVLSTVLSYLLTWVPAIIVVLLYPPS